MLRKVAASVTDVSNELCTICDDMVETMRAARGIGLAANQIGLTTRIICLDVGEKESQPLVILNPEIVESTSEDTAEEGCLSLPGFYETIKRAKKVLVKGITVDGKEFSMECEGLLARAFQHEIDHLNGVLFVDHLSPVKRQLFRKEYMKE